MSIKIYNVGSSNKVYGISYTYNNASMHQIYASDNIVNLQFADDSTRSAQAKLYKSITFGSNVTGIDTRCCYNFTELNVVSFAGKKVRMIGDEAFRLCQSLANVIIPDSVEGIGSNAFTDCTSLASVAFPSKSINFGLRAFYNAGITSLTVNPGLVSDQVFANCRSLTTAAVKGSIGVEMFMDCSSLLNVTVTGIVANVPCGCFKGCVSLTSVSFTSMGSITSVDDEAFCNCTALKSFSLQDTSVTYVGSGVFSGSGVTSVTLPATITQLSQVNSNFLGGSSVVHLKFMGIGSDFIDSNVASFFAFGGDTANLVIESSNGKTYRIDTQGTIGEVGSIVPAGATVYIISVAISNNIPSAPLVGMYKDSQRFIDLVQTAYADKPELILGITRLNDADTPKSNGLGNKSNLNAAFDAALNSGADLLMFHFSDHGGQKGTNHEGQLYLYDGSYMYNELFAQFQKFKNVFAMLDCCYPNSVNTPFTPGPNGTRALFWCACPAHLRSMMHGNVGSDFMTLLVKKFNAEYTWTEQWEKVHIVHSSAKVLPCEYNYGNFPTTDKVFRI